ncbi:MAG: hypothetical protein AAF393_02430 [Pseudomonadota bacterium]
MNNSVAIGLACVIIGLIVVDQRAYDGQYAVFWGRQMVRLIEWLAFWR